MAPLGLVGATGWAGSKWQLPATSNTATWLWNDRAAAATVVWHSHLHLAQRFVELFKVHLRSDPEESIASAMEEMLPWVADAEEAMSGASIIFA